MARRFQLGPDHELRQMLGRLAPGIAFGHDPTHPHDRRPVAERLDLLQLVADVEDRAALLGQPAQGGEELRHLLRRQHRGGLIHDQQLGILQQAADDLDTLALAHREIMHAAVGIERQAIGLGDLDDPRLQAPAQRRIVDGERDVLGDGQRLEQREMLERHADAQPSGEIGAGNADRAPLPANLAGIGMQHAIDDLDQRALAGAVLAEQGMDLAGQDLEIDAVVREAAREALDDALERQKRNSGRWGIGRAQAALPLPLRSPPSAVMFPPVFVVALVA
jgi:hypothetical protein